MGASTFFQKGKGKTLDEAFRLAVYQVSYLYGHGGYTGTLAEKHDYIVIDDKPHSEAEAKAIADSLVHHQRPAHPR